MSLLVTAFLALLLYVQATWYILDDETTTWLLGCAAANDRCSAATSLELCQSECDSTSGCDAVNYASGDCCLQTCAGTIVPQYDQGTGYIKAWKSDDSDPTTQLELSSSSFNKNGEGDPIDVWPDLSANGFVASGTSSQYATASLSGIGGGLALRLGGDLDLDTCMALDGDVFSDAGGLVLSAIVRPVYTDKNEASTDHWLFSFGTEAEGYGISLDTLRFAGFAAPDHGGAAVESTEVPGDGEMMVTLHVMFGFRMDLRLNGFIVASTPITLTGLTSAEVQEGDDAAVDSGPAMVGCSSVSEGQGDSYYNGFVSLVTVFSGFYAPDEVQAFEMDTMAAYGTDFDTCAAGHTCDEDDSGGSCFNNEYSDTDGWTYSCTCSAGWYDNAGTCAESACPSNSNGASIVDGCSCDAGYTGSINPAIGAPYHSGSCEPASCPSDHTGTDVISGCTCGDGWEGSITASDVAPYYVDQCTDVDGCTDVTDCDDIDGAQCADVEAPGTGFTCECSDGYAVEDGFCVDEDECENAPCAEVDSDATCTDHVAPQEGYTCNCSDGYAFIGGTCDFDACVSHSCDSIDAGASCVDAASPDSGYSCDCSEGYYDNAGTCEESLDQADDTSEDGSNLEFSSAVVDSAGVENATGELESSLWFIIGGAALLAIPALACFVRWQLNKKNTKLKELVQMVNQDDDTQKNMLAETNGSPKGSWASRDGSDDQDVTDAVTRALSRSASSPKSDIENQAATAKATKARVLNLARADTFGDDILSASNAKGKTGKKKGVGAGASLLGSKKKRKGGRKGGRNNLDF